MTGKDLALKSSVLTHHSYWHLWLRGSQILLRLRQFIHPCCKRLPEFCHSTSHWSTYPPFPPPTTHAFCTSSRHHPLQTTAQFKHSSRHHPRTTSTKKPRNYVRGRREFFFVSIQFRSRYCFCLMIVYHLYVSYNLNPIQQSSQRSSSCGFPGQPQKSLRSMRAVSSQSENSEN